MLPQETRFSRPSLRCPEVTEVTPAGLNEVEPLAEELVSLLDAHRACRDRLTGEGTDISRFNTSANAADIDRLRAALGYGRRNIDHGPALHRPGRNRPMGRRRYVHG